jgi:hypothetical protein
MKAINRTKHTIHLTALASCLIAGLGALVQPGSLQAMQEKEKTKEILKKEFLIIDMSETKQMREFANNCALLFRWLSMSKRFEECKYPYDETSGEYTILRNTRQQESEHDIHDKIVDARALLEKILKSLKFDDSKPTPAITGTIHLLDTLCHFINSIDGKETALESVLKQAHATFLDLTRTAPYTLSIREKKFLEILEPVLNLNSSQKIDRKLLCTIAELLGAPNTLIEFIQNPQAFAPGLKNKTSKIFGEPIKICKPVRSIQQQKELDEALLDCAKISDFSTYQLLPSFNKWLPFEELLEFGANPNFCKKNRATPLFYVVQNYRQSSAEALKFISLLLKFGADVNRENCNGKTPLSMAVENICVDEDEVQRINKLITLLIPTATRRTLYNAFCIAKREQHNKIADFLYKELAPRPGSQSAFSQVKNPKSWDTNFFFKD